MGNNEKLTKKTVKQPERMKRKEQNLTLSDMRKIQRSN